MKRILLFTILLAGFLSFTLAAEKTILIGPKTIGPGWKDNIVIQPAQFQHAGVGDLMTVYTAEAKRTAQIAMQDPKDWQAVSPEYGSMSVQGTVRMTITAEILEKVQARGLILGGHDYKIMQVTLTPASEIVETVVYKGPAMTLKDDWSTSVPVSKKVFKNVKVGDGLHFQASKVKPGAAIKLMDMTWNVMDKAVDGAQIGPNGFTYYIDEQSQLIKLQLAGPDGISMRVGGKSFRFEKISVISNTSQPDEDYSTAQRAPKEYKLQPGELFHGEKEFPNDWSGNLRLTAEPFQECTENDVLIVSYQLLPGLKEANVTPQMSFRENKGKWYDISGSKEPNWMELNGTDVVLTFDEQSLDKLKTTGLVVTGLGFVLTRIELVSAQ